MSKNPNEVKSQDDVTSVQDKRSVDVLISAVEKCEKLEAENKEYRSALMAIEVETASLGVDIEDMETSLLNISGICRSVLEKEIRSMTRQIDIKQLIPFMKKGWVAMDKDGTWGYYFFEPKILGFVWSCGSPLEFDSLSAVFNIAPVEDWTKSLIRIDESQNNLCITDELENDNAR